MTLKPLLALVVFACATGPSLQLPPVDSPQFEAAVIAAVKARNDDASADRPRIGCIAPTVASQSRTEGKLMPEIVRVIGVYPEQDSQGRRQLKVLRSGQFDERKWVPMPESAIRFTGCGHEADAFRELAADRSTSGVH